MLLRIADAKIPAIERLAIQKTLDKAKADLQLSKVVRAKILIADEFKLNSQPTEKTLKTDTVPGPGLTDIWSHYKAWFGGANARLHIEAMRSVVFDVSWLPDRKARISLKGHKVQYIATALRPMEEGLYSHAVLESCAHHQAIHAGQYAILVRQYLIVADRLDIGDRLRGEFRMRNYMKAMSVEESHCCVGHERTWGITKWQVGSVFRQRLGL